MKNSDLMISNFSPRIFERDYVEGVLGIRLPLNESVPYSARYRRRIIEEQLQLEGFFQSFKKLGGGLKQAALGIRYIVEDPSRIKDFVQAVMDTVNEQFDKFMKWSTKVLKISKKILDEYKWKAMQIVGKFTETLKNAMEKLWDATNSMDGWKKALFAIIAAVGVKYVWDQIKDSGGTELTEEENTKQVLDALESMGEDVSDLRAQMGEAITYTAPSLITALYNTDTDERLDEFIKSLKKATSKVKDKAKKVAGSLKKADKASKGKLSKKAKDSAKDAAKDLAKGDDSDSKESDGAGAGKGEDFLESLPPESRSVLENTVASFKKMAAKIGKKFMAGLAIDAIGGALSGGVATAFKYMGKLFGGVKYVLKVIDAPMSKFVAKVKSDKGEIEEAEKGEDDPTDKDADKKKKNEVFLREYVQQVLIGSLP